MPIYDRHCAKCDELFEVVCKIAERSEPHECPYCGATEGEWQLSAPNFSMEANHGTSRDKKTGFHEVVSKIAGRYPRTPITERL